MPQQRAELVRLGQCKNIEKHQHLIIIVIPKFNMTKDKQNRNFKTITLLNSSISGKKYFYMILAINFENTFVQV